jgi:NAD(P)-dependent dehydrogenase (short-subunit alcohol dehydrogenase family)
MADADEAMWDAVIDTNVKGVFFTSKAALPALTARRGNIVNVGSECSLQGFADSTVYCASKGAVLNLTRAMALELAPEIRVNCICPGAVATDMMFRGADPAARAARRAEASANYPLRTVAEPAEIAQAIAYLASDKARFVTGAAWQMEGGSTAGRGV